LDIHEPPRVSKSNEVLRKNHVITVEPGLYYKKIGGVRIEDTILVTKDGYKNLTRFPKFLRI
jgi:Xaa-Pro aminopeptidase